jgi:hypothetical protein
MHAAVGAENKSSNHFGEVLNFRKVERHGNEGEMRFKSFELLGRLKLLLYE